MFCKSKFMATGCDVQVQVLQVKVYDMCVKMRLLRQMLEIFVSFFFVCVFFYFLCVFFFLIALCCPVTGATDPA
jgi:hypothetical protein